MTDPNTLALNGRLASQHLYQNPIADLQAVFGASFEISSHGLRVVGPVSLEDFQTKIPLLAGMIHGVGSFKTALNYMLGDAVLEARQKFGDERADAIIESICDVYKLDWDTVRQFERVCEAFEERGRRLPTFTASQELLRLKSRVDEEEFWETVEEVRAGGAKTISGGEVVEVEVMPCHAIRELVDKKLGKERKPKLAATISDPTRDAEGYKLAQEVCKALKVIKDTLPERWKLFPESIRNGCIAWEAHMESKAS